MKIWARLCLRRHKSQELERSKSPDSDDFIRRPLKKAQSIDLKFTPFSSQDSTDTAPVLGELVWSGGHGMLYQAEWGGEEAIVRVVCLKGGVPEAPWSDALMSLSHPNLVGCQHIHHCPPERQARRHSVHDSAMSTGSLAGDSLLPQDLVASDDDNNQQWQVSSQDQKMACHKPPSGQHTSDYPHKCPRHDPSIPSLAHNVVDQICRMKDKDRADPCTECIDHRAHKQHDCRSQLPDLGHNNNTAVDNGEGTMDGVHESEVMCQHATQALCQHESSSGFLVPCFDPASSLVEAGGCGDGTSQDSKDDDDEMFCCSRESWMVLEYCNCGTLALALARRWQYMQDGFTLDLEKVMLCVQAICSALSYIHRAGYCHGELSSTTVLLHKQHSAHHSPPTSDAVCFKLTEPPVERIVPLPPGKHNRGDLSPANVAYCDPEVLLGGLVTPAADVFSLGVLMWELVSDARPYSGLQPGRVVEFVVAQGGRPGFPQHVPQRYVQLAQKCWVQEPLARPSAAEVLLEVNNMLEGLCLLQREMESSMGELRRMLAIMC